MGKDKHYHIKDVFKENAKRNWVKYVNLAKSEWPAKSKFNIMQKPMFD